MRNVYSVSEKWFHNLNSQNKFSRNRQNKIFKLCTNCFSVPNGRTNHVTFGHLPMFSTVRTVFCVLRDRAGRKSCLPSPAPVQMLFRLNLTD